MDEKMEEKIVAVDLLKVYQEVDGKKKVATVLGWGDRIQVGKRDGKMIPVSLEIRKGTRTGSVKPERINGFVSKNALFSDPAQNDIMHFTIVDVQQGDGAVLETPDAKTIVLIDGGQNQMFARYLASRYSGTSDDNRLKVSAIVNTHTDADHILGLVEIHKSERHRPFLKPKKSGRSRAKTQEKDFKKLFIHPERVFHNGLVRRPSVKEPLKAFGTTVVKDGRAYVTELVDDVRRLDTSDANKPIAQWVETLKDWTEDGDIEVKRLSDRRGSNDFSFLRQYGLEVTVLGPTEVQANGKPGLPLFHEPPKGIPGAEEPRPAPPRAKVQRYSISHSVNGNSVVLMLKYGNIRLLLTGDLNEEAEDALLAKCGEKKIPLEAEFLKVPHHGSSDFSCKFLGTVRPVISVVSCGDESSSTEYIHPRATLVGALGKYSRQERPAVFVTELVAFMKKMGYAKLITPAGKQKKQGPFFSFKRETFGVVHLAFSKDRMLVFTHSGKRDLKEAYAFCVGPKGEVACEKIRQC